MNTHILASYFKTYPKWCLAAANPLNLTSELVNCHDIFKPALACQQSRSLWLAASKTVFRVHLEIKCLESERNRLFAAFWSISLFDLYFTLFHMTSSWQIVENPLMPNYFTEADIQIWGIYAWLEQRYFGGCQSVENQLSVQISVMMSHVLLRLWG